MEIHPKDKPKFPTILWNKRNCKQSNFCYPNLRSGRQRECMRTAKIGPDLRLLLPKQANCMITLLCYYHRILLCTREVLFLPQWAQEIKT